MSRPDGIRTCAFRIVRTARSRSAVDVAGLSERDTAGVDGHAAASRRYKSTHAAVPVRKRVAGRVPAAPPSAILADRLIAPLRRPERIRLATRARVARNTWVGRRRRGAHHADCHQRHRGEQKSTNTSHGHYLIRLSLTWFVKSPRLRRSIACLRRSSVTKRVALVAVRLACRARACAVRILAPFCRRASQHQAASSRANRYLASGISPQPPGPRHPRVSNGLPMSPPTDSAEPRLGHAGVAAAEEGH